MLCYDTIISYNFLRISAVVNRLQCGFDSNIKQSFICDVVVKLETISLSEVVWWLVISLTVVIMWICDGFYADVWLCDMCVFSYS